MFSTTDPHKWRWCHDQSSYVYQTWADALSKQKAKGLKPGPKRAHPPDNGLFGPKSRSNSTGYILFTVTFLII